MALDKRILDCAMELITALHPNDAHLHELYDYIELNLDLSPKQLSLHKQVLGQIEPNWKHDLRNLLGTAKTNSLLINPVKNYWGLPRRPVGIEFDSEICFDKIMKRASKFVTIMFNLNVSEVVILFQYQHTRKKILS